MRQARHVQTWWWYEKVEKKVNEKSKFEAWCQAKSTAAENAMSKEYVAAKKIAKKSVVLAQQWKRTRLGEKLNTEEGQNMIGVNCLKDESGNIVVKPEMIKKRWREYMEQLLNVDNDWDGIVEGPREFIAAMEVEKAGGLTELMGEIICAAGQVGVKKMTEICNMVVDEEKIPRDWELSTFLPIYKGKGDLL